MPQLWHITVTNVINKDVRHSSLKYPSFLAYCTENAEKRKKMSHDILQFVFCFCTVGYCTVETTCLTGARAFKSPVQTKIQIL